MFRNRLHDDGVRKQMASVSDLHQRWMNEPKYVKAYAALEKKFALASGRDDCAEPREAKKPSVRRPK